MKQKVRTTNLYKLCPVEGRYGVGRKAREEDGISTRGYYMGKADLG